MKNRGISNHRREMAALARAVAAARRLVKTLR